MTTATAPSTTAKAPSVEESGLAAVAKANQAGGTTVATLWGLTATSSESEMPETEDIINLPYVVYRTESVVGAVDSRKLVPKEHFGPGGKYRGMCSSLLFQSPLLCIWISPSKWLKALRSHRQALPSL